MSDSQPVNITGIASGSIALAAAVRKGVCSAVAWFFAHAAPVRLAALFFLLVNLPGARAAGAGSNVLVFCAAYAPGLKTVFVKGADEEYQDLGLSTANIIEVPGTYVRDGKIVLYGAPGENGMRSVVAVAEVNEIKFPLVVLYPADKKSERAYGTKTVDADITRFPLGTFQLVNLSGHQVRISENGVVIELEHSGERVYSPPPPFGKPLAIRIEYKLDDRWTLLSSSSWVSRSDRRTLVCIQLDPLTGRMNVKSAPLRSQTGK